MIFDRIYIYGASGHGKVVADILLTSGVANVAGFVDDRKPVETVVVGLRVCGDGAWLWREAERARIGIALGLGDNACRRSVADACLERHVALVTAVHPSAVVARSAEIGVGAVIMAGAVVNPDARVGRGAIVNTGAIVEHDVVVGDFAHLSPNAATGGAAQIGESSHLGIGAAVLPGIHVGRFTVVGAGAVVARDLPDGVVAAGVPARVRRRLEQDFGQE